MGRTGGSVILFALVGCSAGALQPRDGGTDSQVSGGAGGGGTTGQGAGDGGGVGGAQGGTTGQGARDGGGVGGAQGGTTGQGAGGVGGACPPPSSAGGAGGPSGDADPSSTWCGPDGGFPDDSLPNSGLGTLSLIAGALGGPGRADGIGTAARLRSPRGIASDGAGKLYVADSDNHLIRQVDLATGVVTTLAGSYYDPVVGGRAPCSLDGTGKAARFADPYDVVPGGDGNLYVSDNGAQVIRRVDLATGAVTTLAGATNVRGSTDGVGADARFNGPSSLASDGAGHLFVADNKNRNNGTGALTIRQVDLATGAVTTVAGAACPGVGTAVFSKLAGLASDGAGHLYGVDQGKIFKVDLATHAVTTEVSWYTPLGPGPRPTYGDLLSVAVDGVGGLYVGSASGLLQFNIATRAVTRLADQRAIDLALDGAGNLYLISDVHPSTDQVFRLVAAGGASTPFVGSTMNWSFADGSGADAHFAGPTGVSADGAGNIYVSEAYNLTIRMIAAGTNAVTTLAGAPASAGSVDGVGGAARFSYPVGLVADEDGSTLYISDGCTIRKLTVATQAVTTLAGDVGQTGSADGIGTAALFAYPRGLARDRHGNLFVVDDTVIRQIVVATGAVTTLAGSPSAWESKDGVGADARFAAPAGIASDGEGTLYVGDFDVVRKIDVATAAVSTILIVGGGSGSTALDANGYLYLAGATIQKIDLATKLVTTVVGDQSRDEVILGPLPGALGLFGVTGFALLPTGELAMAVSENAILKAHFF